MPAEVAFHFNAPDRVGYACRLLRKAYLKGARLWVRVGADELGPLDQALWVAQAGDFLPHSRDGDAPEVMRHSPIHLSADTPDPQGRQVLVNLCADMAQGWDRFERVIEVVTLADDDRLPARERWRTYRVQGIEPVRHDLASAAP